MANDYGDHVSPDPADENNGRPEPDHDDEQALARHRAAVEADLSKANETLDRVRREMPYRKALWGYRLYYIGILSSVGSLIAGCVGENSAPMVVIPIALPLGILGYVYGYFQLRREYHAYMSAASAEVWHSRRDRKNLWQSSIFRDAFMGRLR
ncbi:hypothetical protein Snas_3805 [Stackebrandtia nassauensis DSM 44728]|uniref:Transmembrane protein n=1 Tax=Stackebrandtia nassauensis (strain DSM 44728 / CIP 108903 / NRRL B-16338 / NBRC 102104 / LLR-40K-21) TaxID=446470 RepID=D3PYM8_STANL|nr:hypothetical protein Snas_3805 [Stackebrandtia nassauensis DSM 44728]